MKLFLVSPQDDYSERVKFLINKHFNDYHIVLDGRESSIWVVAAENDKTPARISEALNMISAGKNEDEVNHGVVISIGDYYGFDSKALWQQLEVWRDV